MAIRKRLTRYNLGVISEQFQPPYNNLAKSIYVTEGEVIAAAITVGHRNPEHWKTYLNTKYARDDILSRVHFVRAFLDFDQDSNIHHTDLFTQSDPTEKGFINYRLGMIFTKLVAHRLLNTPWLVHYSWLHKNGEVAVAGKSSPDLLGFNAVNQEWSSIEAKGRSQGLPNSVLTTAKTQAQEVTHVNGIALSRHIGGGIYRKGKSKLAFKWRDPEPKGDVKLTMTSTALKNYYAGIFQLYDMKDDDDLQAALGDHVKLSPSLLDLRSLLMSPIERPFDQYIALLRIIQTEAIDTRKTRQADVTVLPEEVNEEIIQDDGLIIISSN